MAESQLGVIHGAMDMRANEGVWMLDEDDWLLIAMLKDPIYCAELLFEDPKNTTYSGCYHVMDYQYPLFRFVQSYQIYPCARSVGKTESAKARAVSHAFRRLGEELLITAPELIHLEGLTGPIEKRILEVRLTRDFLKTEGQRTGITHKPGLRVEFADGTSIAGRIPHQTGRGIKGAHVPDLIVDEAQDYPEKGYIEIQEVVMKDHMDTTGNYDFTYHAYGVYASGHGGKFQQLADSGLYKVTTITAPMRPGWNKAEKQSAAAMYGGTNSPDYRRNVLGEPGQSLSQFFVTAHLMACFTGDTQVATIKGNKKIAEIEEGEWVASASGYGRVNRVRKVRRDRVAVVRIGTEEFTCSPEHPFFVRGIGWCHADRLEPGMTIVDHDDAVRGLRRGAEDPTGALLLEDLRGTVAGEHSRATGDTDASLRALSKELPSPRRGPVLLQSVHGGGGWQVAQAAQEDVSSLRREVSAKSANYSDVQPGVSWQARWRDERDATRTGRSRRVSTEHVDRGSSDCAVSTLASPRARLVRRASDNAPGDVGGRRPLLHRHRGPNTEDRRGSGWPLARASSASGEGRSSGRVASEARVESVAIVERGDRDWARACGGEGPVTLYDLTIQGHPSFTVGRQKLLVHNCMDQDRDSHYNTVEFEAQEIRSEDLDRLIGPKGDPGDLLHLPTNLGQEVYAGMDVGLVTDPTVIKIYTVGLDTKRKPRLKLVRMIHLWRFTEKQIRQCTYKMALTYGKTLRSFGQDIGGLGLPLYQAMDSDEQCPAHLREVSRGYVFNAKVPVAVDNNYVSEQGGKLIDQYGHMVEEIRDKWTGKVQLVARMSMIEASTRYLRRWVDDGYLMFPFHPDLIKDFQGETEQRVRAMAGARKKPNAFHMLDASRVMAMAFHAAQLEEQVYAPQGVPVLDRAVIVG